MNLPHSLWFDLSTPRIILLRFPAFGSEQAQIPWVKNAEANSLARLALSNNYNATSELCVEIKGQPSTEGEQVLKIKEQDEWVTPIVRYLKEGWLPKDKNKK